MKKDMKRTAKKPKEKRQVVGGGEQAARLAIPEFSFEGWEDDALSPALPAQSFHGDIPGSQSELWQLAQKLKEGVDSIFARSETDSSAIGYLCMVIDHALKGMHALAAAGCREATSALIERLALAVEKFELLAYHKPELFLENTRRRMQIPAMISPAAGNGDHKKTLLEKLDVGAKAIFKVVSKGKKGNRWSIDKNANMLAARLVGYIDECRWRASFPASCLEVSEAVSKWFPALANLPDLNETNWRQWAEIGWRVIEGISPDGKPEKHPALSANETKICNVRQGAGDESSTHHYDIKEAFLSAFESMVTGVSARKRQMNAASTRNKRK